MPDWLNTDAVKEKVAGAVAVKTSATPPALIGPLTGGSPQSICRLTQAAPVFLVLKPLDKIRDEFVVGGAFVASSYDEALEVIG